MAIEKFSPAGNDHGVTRRDVFRTGGAAAAALFFGSANAEAQPKKPLRVDAHAHVWTDEYLDLVERYGKKDTSVQRGKGAGPSEAEMDKRFAQMDAAKVDLQVLSICPQAPHFEDKEQAVAAARKIKYPYVQVVAKGPHKIQAP